MYDSEIIWKFLNREYQEDNIVIYLYCCGTIKNHKTAINNVLEFTKKIFCPAISETVLKANIVDYLDLKKKQYHNAEITIKSIY